MTICENILIIGSGGREHALGWKISKNNNVKKIFYANGNGGTYENVKISQTNIKELAKFAKLKKCNTIVGPEMPLSLGIVDLFNSEDLPIFGPTKEAALLETSKKFSKNFMKKNYIPTAEFQTFNDYSKAIDYIDKVNHEVVIKADGLASGKGVFVTDNKKDAISAIDLLLNKKIFGNSSNEIIIEKKINGKEVSIIALCDGKSFIILEPSKDHKRIFDDDKGPNTGGMGSYSPVSNINEEEINKISKTIIKPVLEGMIRNGTPFRGFLYAGLIYEEITNNPYVLEFNVRMGDPECQPLMMRMESDILDYIESAQNQSIDSMKPIKWKDKFSVCVVMASEGYPDKFDKGYEIKGLKDIKTDDNLMVFHAGTKSKEGKILTDGGRVIGVTALGNTIQQAIDKAYFNVRKISWGNNQQTYRKDIAKLEYCLYR
jgi:phosphoribosylamine--glycine ligase